MTFMPTVPSREWRVMVLKNGIARTRIIKSNCGYYLRLTTIWRSSIDIPFLVGTMCQNVLLRFSSVIIINLLLLFNISQLLVPHNPIMWFKQWRITAYDVQAKVACIIPLGWKWFCKCKIEHCITLMPPLKNILLNLMSHP